MSAKYYTQFILTDAQYRGGNEFSGIIELSEAMDHSNKLTHINASQKVMCMLLAGSTIRPGVINPQAVQINSQQKCTLINS